MRTVNFFQKDKQMSEKEYKNLSPCESVFLLREEIRTTISVSCVFCKNDIEFRGLTVFPICENCRKILGELVASHKSNWGK
jgi:hypothetical protein